MKRSKLNGRYVSGHYISHHKSNKGNLFRAYFFTVFSVVFLFGCTYFTLINWDDHSAFQEETVNTNIVYITKKQFDAVDTGMTKEQVFEILGGEGELLSKSHNEYEENVLYMYYGKDTVYGKANFTFAGGKLLSKAQCGLK